MTKVVDRLFSELFDHTFQPPVLSDELQG